FRIQAHHVALGEDADRAPLRVGDHHRADLLGMHPAYRVGDTRLGRHRDYAAALARQDVSQLHGRLLRRIWTIILPLMQDPAPLEEVMRYHERTKHHFARFAPGPGQLDWANQPDPFRR